MEIYKNINNRRQGSTIDLDMVAFHVHDRDLDDIIDIMMTAIITRCIMEFGEPPTIL